MLELPLLGFEGSKFITHQAGVAVAACNEGDASLDGGGDAIEFLLKLTAILVVRLAQPCDLGVELARKCVDEIVVTQKNIFKAG